MKQSLLTYNTKLVLIIGLALGLMSFDQASIGYLLPFIKPDLGLSNTDVGLLASAYWVMFAVSSYLMGVLSDAAGTPRKFLIIALAIFGLCSLFCSIADKISSLLLSRAIMGMMGGALLTLIQSMLSLSSAPERVSMNMGLVNGFGGNLMGLIVAPLLLVQIALAFGWRAGYMVVTLPALVCALLILRMIYEPTKKAGSESTVTSDDPYTVLDGVRDALRFRNIRLCVILCSLFVAYVSLGLTFMPLFLVGGRGYSVEQMSLLVVLLGVSGILFSVTLPMLSNRFGRKPVMIVTGISSMLTPLAAFYYGGTIFVLGPLLFCGWAMAGSGAFSMGIIPSETVGPKIISTALGIIIAAGVLLGGLAGPSIAGWSADQWGVGAPLIIQSGCAFLAGLTSMFLHETAPGLRSNTLSETVQPVQT